MDAQEQRVYHPETQGSELRLKFSMGSFGALKKLQIAHFITQLANNSSEMLTIIWHRSKLTKQALVKCMVAT